MPTVGNVSAGKAKVGGAVYWGDIDSVTAPSSISASLSDFTELGYVSDAGLVNSPAVTNTAIKAWGGDTVLNIQTEKVDNFTFTLLEVLNPDVLSVIYGAGNVSGTLAAGITIEANSDEQEDAVWVFDMTMRNGAAKRIVIPIGKITNIADITYSDSAAVGYQITVSAQPDSSGNTHYEYIKAS